MAEKRKGIEGLPDTWSPLLGGAQVAQNEEEVAELYAQLPKGSLKEQQRLSAEAGKKDKKGRR